MELLPTQSSFGIGDPVEIEVRGGPESAELIVRRLGDVVQRHEYRGEARLRLTGLAAGAYGIELTGPYPDKCHTSVLGRRNYQWGHLFFP